MNLIQIKYFLEVAGCLNFTAAAARLFVSQQCVSKQVAKLEREIGVKLFDRSTARVALTEAGKLLQGEWSAMLERSDQAVERARALQSAARPALRLGLLELCGVVDFVLPRLSAFQAAHPDRELEYEIGGFLQIQDWLFQGMVDAIVTFNYEVARLPDRYQYRDLKELNVAIILSSRHHLAGRECVTLSDLRGELIYAFAPTYSTYASDTVLTHCRRLGFEPEFKYFSSINAMEMALQSGKGLSVAFREFYRNQDHDLIFHPVRVMEGWRQPFISVCWSQENTPRLAELLQALEQPGVPFLDGPDQP